MRGRAAIAGIGLTSFERQGTRSELAMGLEAIQLALADAGLSIGDVDGLVKNAMEATQEIQVARNLGIADLSYFGEVHYGGGSTCALVGHAAAAIAAGLAECVVCWRTRKRGRADRPWAALDGHVAGDAQWSVPFGLVRPSDQVALLARRHMIEYGTTSAQFGAVAVACRAHASRNPAALMREPITLEDHQRSRMVSDPLRLLDCCLESDAGGAVVVTSTERARDLRQTPALILGAAQAMGPEPVRMNDFLKPDVLDSQGRYAAERIYRMADLRPADIDTVQIYDSFTPYVIFALEAYGFCKRGEGGPFAAAGHLQWPDGDLPVNTSGGGLSEGYVQGFNLLVEAVRQIRGSSTAQVPDARHVLVTSATSVPTSALVLGKR